VNERVNEIYKKVYVKLDVGKKYITL
jgi:hypothetical protein